MSLFADAAFSSFSWIYDVGVVADEPAQVSEEVIDIGLRIGNNRVDEFDGIHSEYSGVNRSGDCGNVSV